MLELLYFVYGVFLQDMQAIADADEEQILDKRQVYQPKPAEYPFFGCIYTQETQSRELKGRIFDAFGEANLTDIQISDLELSFVKLYFGTAPKEGIVYQFQKQGNLYVGTYSSPHVGSERVQLILTKGSEVTFGFPTKMHR